jgi:unsaturated rhamnogalacturonyl hydrolase
MNMTQRLYYTKVVELANYIVKTWDPKMKWMWGEALLGYALARLDQHQGTDDYTPFLRGYCDYYVAHQPPVDQSDTAAPGLITYMMQKKTNNPDYKALTQRVLDYIRHEPRLIEDSVNHLGNSLIGRFYPKSIWVDSLMMFSVFPAIYAKNEKDPELMDIALRQPRVMAKYMMDPDSNLWYHSYWVKKKTHYPKRKLFWGRGNGWVIAALPMLLDQSDDHKEKATIISLFRKTSEALIKYQRPDGTFETVLNKPGKTYRELSATLLIASGWFRGYRQGLLDKRFLDAAIKAYHASVDSLIYEESHIYLPEISAPTIPLPLLPYLGYKWTPRGKNWSYGLAALIFAAIEYDTVCTEVKKDL